MSSTTIVNNSRVGFPVFAILGLIFVTLKLTGVINWSWLWVLSPFWIPFALVGAIAFVAGLVLLGIYTKKRHF